MVNVSCPVCAEVLPPKGATGPRPVYCSKPCKRRADYLRRKAAGTAYRPQDKGKSARTCIECGAPFEAKRIDAALCSRACNNRRLDRLNTKRCSEMDCDRGVRAKGLCAMHWRRVARADGREVAPVWDGRRKSHWKKRQSLKRGAGTVETIDYSAVFERDGWVCGLCADPVDGDLAWPDPMSPSLDHVLPLSRGGSHTMSNVQLAHLVCNLRKGDRAA